MKPLLLTRPQADSQQLAKTLQKAGIPSRLCPLLHIRPLAVNIPQKAYDGIILTSRHAIQAATAFAKLPAYIVGGQTAEAAREAGFTDIRRIAPDAQTLAGLIPPSGAWLYLSGEHITQDFMRAERYAVYAAEALPSLPDAIRQSLRAGDIGGVVFYSRRTAEIFHHLTTSAERHGLTAYCLSPAIAETCEKMGDWAGVATSAAPTQAALLETLFHAEK